MTNIVKENWVALSSNCNYFVSDLGRIKSKRGRILSPTDNGSGYLICSYRVYGRKVSYYVHRVVAEAFVANPACLGRVNHRDGNKRNNLYSNLEWCTAKQNSEHAVKIGLIKSGFDHINSIPVLDLETGVFYAHVKEAASAKNITWQTLYTWLKKPHRNKSSLIYV